MGADAGDQQRVWRRAARAGERQDDRLIRPRVPAAGRQRPEACGQILDHKLTRGPDHLGQGPRNRGHVLRNRQMHRLGGTLVVLPSAHGDKLRVLAFFVEKIEKDEWEIQLIGRQSLGGNAIRLLFGLPFRGARGQIVQHPDLAFALDLGGRFLHGIQQAADRSVVPGHGTVREGEVRLFGHSTAADEQLQVLGPCGWPSLLDTPGHRPGDVPDLRPDLRGRSRERRRVFIPQDWAIRIVVQMQQFRAPPKQHGEPAAQHDTQHCF